MIIDKTKGNWCKEGESDYIDDIAFQLYLNYYYKEYGDFNDDSPQNNFKTVRYTHNSPWYSFYIKSFKNLRIEKLKKLENVNR